MKIPSTILIAGIVVLLFSGSTVSAKDPDVVQLQVDVAKLQRTVQALQDSMDAKNAALVSQMEKIADQVNNLNDSLRKITDLVGTIKSDNAATAASAAKSANDTRDALVPLIGELRKGIGEIKEGQSAIASQTKGLSEQLIAMKSTSAPLPTCKDFKQDADSSANSGYYDDAISGYREFMSNPKCAMDPKAPEVQYAIADTLYQQKKFDQAILDYDIFLMNYPGHDKTASALLRKGLALAATNKISEAKAILTRVTTEFKNTSEFTIATAKLKEPAFAAAGRGGRGTP